MASGTLDTRIGAYPALVPCKNALPARNRLGVAQEIQEIYQTFGGQSIKTTHRQEELVNLFEEGLQLKQKHIYVLTRTLRIPFDDLRDTSFTVVRGGDL